MGPTNHLLGYLGWPGVPSKDVMDMNHLANEVKAWADQAFPARTDASMFLKLYGEVAELIDAGDDCADEVADILILILDYAKRKGVNPSTAVQNKLRINRGRTWVQLPNGTMQHAES